MTAAIGVGGLVAAASRRSAALAIAGAILLGSVFVVGVHRGIRVHSIPNEDLRAPSRYLAAHRSRGDIVVVDQVSNWGFAYYWPPGSLKIIPSDQNLQQFLAVLPDEPRILFSTARSATAIHAVIAKAVALAATGGASARVWVVYQHAAPRVRAMYAAAARSLGFTLRMVWTNQLLQLQHISVVQQAGGQRRSRE